MAGVLPAAGTLEKSGFAACPVYTAGVGMSGKVLEQPPQIAATSRVPARRTAQDLSATTISFAMCSGRLRRPEAILDSCRHTSQITAARLTLVK